MKRIKALDRAKKVIKDQTARLDQEVALATRLKAEMVSLREQLAEKYTAITRLHEQAAVAQKEINAMSLERDRIMRIVDQFLSVQIIGHGQTLNGGNVLSQQPKELRRT